MQSIRVFRTTQERNSYIVASLDSKKATEKISKAVGLSKRQVERINTEYRINGRLSRKKGSGRPEVLSKGDKLSFLEEWEPIQKAHSELFFLSTASDALFAQLEGISKRLDFHTKKLNSSQNLLLDISKQC